MIEIKKLSFYRGSRLIFDQIDLQIEQGEIIAIMGPSGTGKTTLLQLISGQLRPHTGQVLFQGQDIHRCSPAQLYRLRLQMGLLFQTGALLTDLSVFENVAFPLRMHTDLEESLLRKLVLLKLEAVGLRGARDLMPNQLSGGMARRAALARAIALDPAFIMYDEPFAGQDPISMGMLLQLIKKLNDAAHLTSLIVSHDVEETFAIADRVYLIADGRIIASGSPDTLKQNDSPWVQQFLRGLPDGSVPFHYPAPDLEQDLLEKKTSIPK